MKPIDVSVIIPTCNRSGSLTRLLASLEAQRSNAASFEVLVVDNNSTDDTSRVVARFAARERLRLRYVFEPRPGVSHARNTGISHATGAILGFLDDDVEPAADWVATVYRTLFEHPEADCIGGPVRPRWPEPPPAWLTAAHSSPLALQDKTPWMYVNAENASTCLATENFACWRTIFDEIGGFDPAFVRCEDRDFQLRLWGAGKQGLYTPELVVTTEVPRERLTKAYHRRWWATRGRFLALMKFHERIDSSNRLRADPGRSLFGTPLFLYRSVFSHLLAWPGAVLRRDPSAAFFHETRARDGWAYIVARYRSEYAARPIRVRLAELRRLRHAAIAAGRPLVRHGRR
jgi:glycosyltransferase involved in cell wall biosynthesis